MQTYPDCVIAAMITDSAVEGDGCDYLDVPSSDDNAKEHSNGSYAALDTGTWIGHHTTSHLLVPNRYPNDCTTSTPGPCDESQNPNVESDRPLATTANSYFVGDDTECPSNSDGTVLDPVSDDPSVFSNYYGDSESLDDDNSLALDDLIDFVNKLKDSFQQDLQSLTRGIELGGIRPDIDMAAPTLDHGEPPTLTLASGEQPTIVA